MIKLASLGLVLAALPLCFGSASAFVAAPALSGFSTESAVTPVAMCGRSCRNGGRYIPGPPQVCEENDLNYCGPSRGRGGPAYGPGPGYGPGPAPGVGIGIPGTGIGVYVAPPQQNCRTFPVQRSDGSWRQVTRCD
jgi:hypothetical protein